MNVMLTLCITTIYIFKNIWVNLNNQIQNYNSITGKFCVLKSSSCICCLVRVHLLWLPEWKRVSQLFPFKKDNRKQCSQNSNRSGSNRWNYSQQTIVGNRLLCSHLRDESRLHWSMLNGSIWAYPCGTRKKNGGNMTVFLNKLKNVIPSLL